MSDLWFTSDTHFFHEDVLKFTAADGTRTRPLWSNIGEMNADLIDRWNTRVKPQDEVWHMGDVAFQTIERSDEVDTLLGNLNGHKHLLVGNHDNLKSAAFTSHFESIELWKGFKAQEFTCSHIPMRLDSLVAGCVNVHGHLHQNRMNESGYVNVCVETRNFAPVHMDEVISDVRRAFQRI